MKKLNYLVMFIALALISACSSIHKNSDHKYPLNDKSTSFRKPSSIENDSYIHIWLDPKSSNYGFYIGFKGEAADSVYSGLQANAGSEIHHYKPASEFDRRRGQLGFRYILCEILEDGISKDCRIHFSPEQESFNSPAIPKQKISMPKIYSSIEESLSYEQLPGLKFKAVITGKPAEFFFNGIGSVVGKQSNEIVTSPQMICSRISQSYACSFIFQAYTGEDVEKAEYKTNRFLNLDLKIFQNELHRSISTSDE